MSFWSALGLPGSPKTPAVEVLAQWIQWAVYGVEAGIMQSSGHSYFEPNWTDVFTGQWWRQPTNQDEVLYNLGQFDLLLPAALQYSPNDETTKQVYRLKVIAEGLRYLVEAQLIPTVSPSFWSYFRAMVFGGTPERPKTIAMATEAKRAASAAAEAAARAGMPEVAAYYAEKETSVDKIVSDSDKFWSEPGLPVMSSIPGVLLIALVIGGGIFASRVL